MQLQTFQGSTMAEALHRVKVTLGHNAIILHTRTIPQKRWLGLRRYQTFEITASRDVKVVNRQLPAKPAPNPAAQRPQTRIMPKPSPVARIESTVAQTVAQQTQTLLNSPAATAPAMIAIGEEMKKLKDTVAELATSVRMNHKPNVPEGLFDQYLQLVENMVAEELAVEITKSIDRQLRPEMLNDKTLVRQKLIECMEKLIPTTGPITRTKTTGPHIVALIGPTGVGKTTTIAKLAANLKLREKRKVGLITLDTFRIAAIDQLKRYADILAAPLKVVGRPEEIKAAIDSMADCDFILIDTAGRSPKDTLKLTELKRFLEFARPDEVHLVLSTNCDQKSVELAVQNFGEVRFDKLIFTKLDETAQVGVVLNVIKKVNKGLAYVTTGQDVPDDIEVGNGGMLAKLLLGTKN